MNPEAIDIPDRPEPVPGCGPTDGKVLVKRFDFTAIDGDFARLLSTTTGRSFLESIDFTSAREYRVHCWYEAHRCFADYKNEPSTAEGRKCRLPRSQIEMASRAGMSFDQVRAGLDISAAHLKAVQKRLKIRLRHRPHPDLENLDLGNALPGRDVIAEKLGATALPDAPDGTNFVNPAEGTIIMAEDTSKRNKAARRHHFRGDELAQWIKEIYDDFVAKNDHPPSKNYFETEFGITHASVVKYWPVQAVPTAGVEPEANVSGSSELKAASPTIRPALIDDLELVSSAAEHAFGNALIAGAYTDASGKHHCDEVVEVEGEFKPMIRQWRRHVEVTRTILAFAVRHAA